MRNINFFGQPISAYSADYSGNDASDVRHVGRNEDVIDEERVSRVDFKSRLDDDGRQGQAADGLGTFHDVEGPCGVECAVHA